jgi:hypothetical protein
MSFLLSRSVKNLAEHLLAIRHRFYTWKEKLERKGTKTLSRVVSESRD